VVEIVRRVTGYFGKMRRLPTVLLATTRDYRLVPAYRIAGQARNDVKDCHAVTTFTGATTG